MDHDAANMAGVEIAEHLIQIHDDQRCDCGVTMSYYCVICRNKCCMDCTNRHSDYGKHMLIQVFRGIYDCIAIKSKDCERMWMGSIITHKRNMVRLVRKHLGCECDFLGHRPAYCSIQCFFQRNCLSVDQMKMKNEGAKLARV